MKIYCTPDRCVFWLDTIAPEGYLPVNFDRCRLEVFAKDVHRLRYLSEYPWLEVWNVDIYDIYK